MRTCDDHRLKGWFFLPDTPSSRVPGILTWSQDEGAVLELIGGLGSEARFEEILPGVARAGQSVPDATPCTIYAVTDSGKKLSLWAAERGNLKADSRGKVFEEFWRAGWVCIGAHLPSADEADLRHVSIGLDYLYDLTLDGRFCPPQWAQIEGVEKPGERQADGTLLVPFTMPVVGGHRASVDKGSLGEFRYRIGTQATRPWFSPATEAMPELKLDMMTRRRRSGPSIELTVSAYARIEWSGDCAGSGEVALQSMQPLVGLMSLATFDRAGLEWLHARTRAGEQVSLLCRTGNESKPDQTAEPSGLVFTLEDVSLQSFLGTWSRLSSRPQAKYAWSLVVGMIGHSPLMVEEHIGQVLAAAEGFHTWCLARKEEDSLRSRLVNLHDELPDAVKLRLKVDVERWSDWSVWARNHVAHGGTKKHRAVGDFYQLKVIADSVRLITYLAALKEIGVPESKVADALITHRRLRVLTERCADLSSLPVPPR